MDIIRIVNSLVLWRLFFFSLWLVLVLVLHSVSPLYRPSLIDVKGQRKVKIWENLCEGEG